MSTVNIGKAMEAVQALDSMMYEVEADYEELEKAMNDQRDNVLLAVSGLRKVRDNVDDGGVRYILDYWIRHLNKTATEMTEAGEY